MIGGICRVKIYGDYTGRGSKSYGNCDGAFLMGSFRLIYRVFLAHMGLVT